MEIGRLFRISSRSHLAGIILLFSFLTGLGLWLAAEFDYERTEDRARILLQKTAASLDERMKRTIVATELILKFATERIQEIGIERTVSSGREWERLRSYAAALPDVGSLWLLDAKADLLMDSTRYPSQPMNFADREYFAPQKDKSIEIYIGPVVKGRITQKFSFTITRRITGRDGAFAGILVAAIETDDFTNFLRNIAIGENGAVAVWRTDGRLILRQPMEDEYLNKDFSYLKVFKVSLQESPSGFFFSDKTVDGIGRLVAYQKMKELPLLVVTSIPSASIRRAWYANVKNYSVIAALSLCGLVALAWLVYRSVAKEESARREVEAAHDKLAKLNAELEQRVLDRTSQLVSANRDLSNEINERKRAEEELRQSERRFRALAEALPQIVWTADAGGGVEWFNQRWYEYTGEPHGVGEGWSWKKVAHPDDMAHTLKNWQEAREKGALFQNELRVRRHDGKYRWFLARAWPMRNADENIIRWFGTNTDIHDMKGNEAALRQSQLDMDRAQEVGEIGSWRMDIRRNALAWSDENHRIFGVPKGRPLTYETFLGIVHLEDRRYVDTKWQAGLRGEPYDIEHRIVVDRQVKWVREKAYLEFDNEGKLLGGFGITQDITARKRMEEELRVSRDELEIRVGERTEELEKSQQRLQQLASQLLLAQEKERKRVAVELHDGLMSELAATKFLLEGKIMLLDNGKQIDSGDLRRVADILAGTMREARRLMNNLHPSLLDELGLSAAIGWLCGEYQRFYPHILVQKEIAVSEKDISESLKVVIYRVLQEALNNFAKHGKGDRVEVSLSKSDETFSFVIRDNGQGFDVENVQKGLGLESMRERVELSGGQFQLDSIIGQGTTIRLSWTFL